MLKEIFTISNYPYLDRDAAFINKLATFFKTYGIILLAMIIFAPVILLADKFITTVLHHKSLDHQSREMIKQLFKKMGYIPAFIFVCVIGPMLEELMFRSPLTFKRRQIALAIVIASVYFGLNVFHIEVTEPWVAFTVLVVLVIAGIGLLFIPNTSLIIPPERQKLFIMLSIFLFGLMHIFNFKPIEWPLIWIYPLFVMPQMIMGWAITYIRFKNGFFWGVALHCMINTISTLLAFGITKPL
jgi:hypothetical protein